jgi:hypothetical protein
LGDVSVGGSGLRNRKSPRLLIGVLRVRDRLETVETPLNRTKKSRKALQKLFFFALIAFFLRAACSGAAS